MLEWAMRLWSIRSTTDVIRVYFNNYTSYISFGKIMIYNILPLTPIILYLIPYFNTSHTVCARCWRTGVCQMKSEWKHLKINLKMPDFWLKKPTENTMRWFCWFQLGSARLISADYCCNPLLTLCCWFFKVVLLIPTLVLYIFFPIFLWHIFIYFGFLRLFPFFWFYFSIPFYCALRYVLLYIVIFYIVVFFLTSACLTFSPLISSFFHLFYFIIFEKIIH